MYRLPRYAYQVCLLSARLIPPRLVGTDFDYCSGCYDAHWQEHNDGKHRFVLFRYPTPSIVIERVIAPVKKLTGDVDPWTIEHRPAPDAAVPQKDRGEADATAPEGMSRSSSRVDWGEQSFINDPTATDPLVIPPPAEDTAGHHCRGSCQRSIPEGLVYRCLTCQYAASHDGSGAFGIRLRVLAR